MSPSYDLDTPDHFTAGAVGAPGERVFYVQGRQGRRVVSLKAEKEQVRALGEYLAGLLVRLGGGAGLPGAAQQNLLEPITEAWSIGAIAVGYDESRDRILIEAREIQEEAEEGQEGQESQESQPQSAEEPATARFAISRAQAAAFAERARALMKTGRPTCPMCDQTLTADHVCPRANGHVIHH
jgi:uncharacterized repeat protein (TIGR03847 family)